MKLYTQEQLSIAIHSAKANPEQANLILDMLKPVELPSDEEIEQVALDFAKKYRATTYEISALIIGAKWMRDKIQVGEK